MKTISLLDRRHLVDVARRDTEDRRAVLIDDLETLLRSVPADERLRRIAKHLPLPQLARLGRELTAKPPGVRANIRRRTVE